MLFFKIKWLNRKLSMRLETKLIHWSKSFMLSKTKLTNFFVLVLSLFSSFFFPNYGFRMPKFFIPQKKRKILHQWLIEVVDHICKQSETDINKPSNTSKEDYFKTTLNFISINSRDNYKDFNHKNLIEFNYFSFFIDLFFTIPLLK